MSREIWKDVEGYESLYQVSNKGRVKSLPRRGTFSRPTIRAATYDSGRYLQVCLCKNSVQRTYKVHKLVARAFIPNPLGYKEINHKDEDKTNNCVENLEWCSRAYNVNYGSRNDKTRKPVVQMSLDGKVIAEHAGLGVAARAIGAKGRSGIADVCNGKRKTALGYKWMWKENYNGKSL